MVIVSVDIFLWPGPATAGGPDASDNKDTSYAIFR